MEDRNSHQQSRNVLELLSSATGVESAKNVNESNKTIQPLNDRAELTGEQISAKVQNIKREAMSNGSLSLDSGTFANLVSSLEAGDSITKTSRESSLSSAETLPPSSSSMQTSNDCQTKDSFLGIKAELSDLSVEKDEFFSDTIDLSPEDIQKTLSANLPQSSCSRDTPNSGVDVNPMDFIDNDIASQDDDVLANLYAFDMLTDFPDLDHYDTSPLDHANSNNSDTSSSTSTNHSSAKSVANQSQQTVKMDFRENTANISDYSPEWAYPEVRTTGLAGLVVEHCI